MSQDPNKPFTKAADACQYAATVSRRNHSHRYIIQTGDVFYVSTTADCQSYERLYAHYYDGLEWSLHEFEEKLRKKCRSLSDLFNVGRTKLVGSLPILELRKYFSEDFIYNDLKAWAEKRGLRAKLKFEGQTGGGAFYVWNSKGLMAFLSTHEQALTVARIPITPEAYIDHIEKHPVSKDDFPVAYSLIGKTFNDARFRHAYTETQPTL